MHERPQVKRRFDRFSRVRGQEFADWYEFMAFHETRIRRAVRLFRTLSAADIDDVVQETWERFWSKMDTIRDADAVGAWLATTARNRAVQRLRNHPACSSLTVEVSDRTASDPSEYTVVGHEQAAMRRAWARLRPGDQYILDALVIHGRVDYRNAAHTLRRPVGSLGPTRARALRRLEALYEEEFGAHVPSMSG